MPTTEPAAAPAYTQTCAACGETVTREADWERLARCPRCSQRLPTPHTFAPKSGTMSAQGGR